MLEARRAKSARNGEVAYPFDDEQDGAFIDIKRILVTNPKAHFYCCGPKAMLAAYKKALRELRLPRERSHVEYFSASEEAARDGGFDVVLQQSGKTPHVDPGLAILDVLIANNVSVPFPAQKVSAARAIEGRPDHRDMVFTDDERSKSETMMVCCAGSKSTCLVFD